MIVVHFVDIKAFRHHLSLGMMISKPVSIKYWRNESRLYLAKLAEPDAKGRRKSVPVEGPNFSAAWLRAGGNKNGQALYPVRSCF
jgi:hypothetical protein